MARSLAEALTEAFLDRPMNSMIEKGRARESSRDLARTAEIAALAWLASPDGLLSDAAIEAAARNGIERGRIWGDLGHNAAIADARAAIVAALGAISERTEA